MRQAPFPFHNSQKSALILEVPGVEKIKSRRCSVHFTYKQNKKYEMDHFNDYQYEGMRRFHFMALQIKVKQWETDLIKTHVTTFGKYFSFLSSL